jgi:hypothetical protein
VPGVVVVLAAQPPLACRDFDTEADLVAGRAELRVPRSIAGRSIAPVATRNGSWQLPQKRDATAPFSSRNASVATR